jgi:hypothetical protein
MCGDGRKKGYWCEEYNTSRSIFIFKVLVEGMMVERIIAEENCTLKVPEEKASKKFSEEKQRKRRLSSIRLQPLLPEGSNKESGNELGTCFIQAAQTPIPDIPLTPGSTPPATPLPEIPATPEPEIPATPRGDVAALAPSNAMAVEVVAIKHFLHVLQAIKEGHMEVWRDTQDREGKEGSSGEFFSVLAPLLIVAILALFVSYYLSRH